jgi:hypothetical protein
MYQKDSILHPRKADWLLMHRRDDLLAIMEDNGKPVIFSRWSHTHARPVQL